MDWAAWGFVYHNVFWLASINSLFPLGQNVENILLSVYQGTLFPFASGPNKAWHGPVLLSHPQAWVGAMLCNVYLLFSPLSKMRRTFSYHFYPTLHPLPSKNESRSYFLSSLNFSMLLPTSVMKAKQKWL